MIDKPHPENEPRHQAIKVVVTDIRDWLNGLVSSLEEGGIRSGDLDYVVRELRAVEVRLERLTSLAVLDR